MPFHQFWDLLQLGSIHLSGRKVRHSKSLNGCQNFVLQIWSQSCEIESSFFTTTWQPHIVYGISLFIICSPFNVNLRCYTTTSLCTNHSSLWTQHPSCQCQKSKSKIYPPHVHGTINAFGRTHPLTTLPHHRRQPRSSAVSGVGRIHNWRQRAQILLVVVVVEETKEDRIERWRTTCHLLMIGPWRRMTCTLLWIVRWVLLHQMMQILSSLSYLNTRITHTHSSQLVNLRWWV